MGIDLFFETMEWLTPQLRADDLEGCELAAVDVLLALPQSGNFPKTLTVLII